MKRLIHVRHEYTQLKTGHACLQAGKDKFEHVRIHGVHHDGCDAEPSFVISLVRCEPVRNELYALAKAYFDRSEAEGDS